MNIRKAEEKDVPEIMELLKQVLELHAKIRPDIFVPGTTKYTREELLKILNNPQTPVFVAEEGGKVAGYAFCIEKRQPFSTTMRDFKTLFIDDLCVDETIRGKHVGQSLYEYVLAYAKELGCYDVTLNVWEGNDGARKFYEKMGMKVKETQMQTILW